jgi:hypothetical protein
MIVFRQTAGGTVVQSRPRTSGKVTEAQRAQRRKFQRAVLYAGVTVNDPELGPAYAAKAKPGQSARNVAVADYMHAPDIEEIDVSGDRGLPGDVIRIIATDDFAVKEVKVVITRADGTPVEEGYAVQEPAGYEWTYTAVAENATQDGDRIEVYASDHPGNISKAEKEI